MYDSRPILLVEDGQATAPSVDAALDELGIRHVMVRVSDAEEARVCLRDTFKGEPSVIFVDSPSGRDNILELVRVVKQDERLKNIPVIAMTPSEDVEVVDESFELGAAGYVVKSADRDEFIETIRAICRYWTLSQVPADI
jgi:two-component system, response regulator